MYIFLWKKKLFTILTQDIIALDNYVQYIFHVEIEIWHERAGEKETDCLRESEG